MSRIVVVMLVSGAFSLPAMAEEPCAAPVSARSFHQIVSAGDAAYADMDLEAFQTARVTARQMFACLDEGITPAQAAGFHRLEALGYFLARDHANAVSSLRSLNAAAPGYALSTEIAPPNHPLRMYYDIAEQLVSLPAQPLPLAKSGWTEIDGSTATAWPVDRPYLIQKFDESGKVVLSSFQTAGTPPAGVLSEPKTLTAHTPKVQTAKTLSLVAGGSALLAGGLYLGARSSASQFWDPATPSSELDALRRRTNGLGWSSAGVGLVALGTGCAAIYVGTW